jgi:hypothetical protein
MLTPGFFSQYHAQGCGFEDRLGEKNSWPKQPDFLLDENRGWSRPEVCCYYVQIVARIVQMSGVKTS